MPQLTADPGIVRVLIALGPDFTAKEWALRLGVTLDEVLDAANITPYARVKPEPAPLATTRRRVDQSAMIVEAIQKGHYVTKDIAAFTGLHPQTIRSKLTLLETQGVIFRCGSGCKSRWLTT
jgi:predicted Rossmann fold nucleotide-binding protein DprA/Smf involved in DNA uptake